jgi:hypothetical protein
MGDHKKIQREIDSVFQKQGTANHHSGYGPTTLQTSFVCCSLKQFNKIPVALLAGG